VTPPRRLNPRVPRALERICRKALAAEPGQRYPSAAALGEDLRRYLGRPRRRAAALGALAAGVLCGLMAWLLAGGLVRRPPSGGASPGAPAAVAPLSGDLNVLVWSPEKRGLKVQEWGALPVRNKEQVQVEVRLNRPAHVYLLWLDSEGVLTPLYPWNVGVRLVHKDLAAPPPDVPPQDVVLSPGDVASGWTVGGRSGLDTILLLARREPLPAGVALAERVGRLPPTPFHNPHEWAVRGFDPDQPGGLLNLGGERGPEDEAAKIDDPLLGLMARLRGHFEMVRAVRFAHQGD
jgi:hypothetical protein